MITLRLESAFLKKIDRFVDDKDVHSRTEFIRNAIREKIDDFETREALKEIALLRGSAKKKVSEEDLNDYFFEILKIIRKYFT